MKNPHIPKYTWAVAAMVFWGFSFIWTSKLLIYFHPITIITIRLIISTIVLFLFSILSGLHQRIQRKDLGLVFLSATLNPFFYFLFENYGLKYSTPTIAAVIIATIPIFSAIAAFLMARERLTPVNLIGVAISFIGVVTMLINPAMELQADKTGVLFLFLAVFSAVFYSVLLKKLTSRYSALTLISYQNLIGIFLFSPYFFLVEAEQAFSVPITFDIIASFLFLSILASSVAFVFFAHSVKILGISKSNIFSNLIPVFTAFFSFLLIGERFSVPKIIGIALVVGGVYLSERSRRNQSSPIVS